MSLDLTHVARHVLITGLTGKGKSTLVRSIAAKSRAPWKFAFETYKREFSSRPPHGLDWAACTDKPSLERALFARKPSAFFFGPLFPGDRVGAFNFWIRWVYEMGKKLKGTKEIYIEEVESTAEHENSPIAPGFREMLDEGRAYKFDVIMIAQRLSTTNRVVLTAAKELVTFQHVDDGELDWIRRKGIDPARAATLQRGEYIWRNRETGEERIHAKRPSADPKGKRDSPARRAG